MPKRLFTFALLIFSLSAMAVAAQVNPPDAASQLNKLDAISILRFIYREQSFTTVSASEQDPLAARRYQVGAVESHTTAVLNRLMGKFTQSEKMEMIATVGIDTGSDSLTPLPTGIYALLIELDKNGFPQLIARPKLLERKTPPFAGKQWKPLIAADLDFDKQDDLIMLDADARTGAERYSIYKWDGKDFVQMNNHPAGALLDFYALLDGAARAGADKEAGRANLAAAIEYCSPKLQGLQTVDGLGRRLAEARGVEVESFKLMIKSENSALIRLQYSLAGSSGGPRQFQGDYQMKRFGERWQLDSERLKAVGQ